MSVFHQNILAGASGAAGAAGATYVDDVFSCFLYDGNGSSQTVTNNIDLAGEGGAVWLKSRTSQTYANHVLVDSERITNGRHHNLFPNDNNGESIPATNAGASVTGFNSDGFDVGGDDNANTNNSKMVSWTFRKAPGFFDVVTWTGNGGNRNISHDLGSVPGCIILKRTDTSDSKEWTVFHRSLSTHSSGYPNQFLKLNSNAAAFGDSGIMPSYPTSTQFSVSADFNASGGTAKYVAYIFAHDDQSFGTDEDEAIIKCDQYTGNGTSDGPEIDLGFEPQWVMIKARDESGSFRNWAIFDNMRGVVSGNADKILSANLTTQEDSGQNSASTNFIDFTPTGFKLSDSGMNVTDKASQRYIYIAIRRPHKPPTDGDDVFKPVAATNGDQATTTGFVADHCIWGSRGSSIYNFVSASRLTGKGALVTSGGAAENTGYFSTTVWETNDGMNSRGVFSSSTSTISWFFKRAPGFFDVVAYDGTGAATISHNLGVTPKLVIVKQRNASRNWTVMVTDLGVGYMFLNSTGAYSSSDTTIFTSTPTSTGVPVSSGNFAGGSGNTYIMYLFATLDGISKVGTYSGTGNNVDVDCGFSAGARFVLIKRTNGIGGWFVWDTARGIASGNDPNSRLDTTDAESTNDDYIDPLNSGFTVTSSAPATLNTSGGTYMFLAIA